MEQGSFSSRAGGQPKPALDTGYETEQDTMASRLPTEPGGLAEDRQAPGQGPRQFGVKCELKFAGSDAG